MKRWFDIAVAAILLLAALPVLILAALMIRWKLGSPVLFKQQRPGLHGKPFTIYKFRTMTSETDADGRLLPDEQRLTPFGRWLRRFSIDELPQLVNVLNGELSIVGPRPLLMEYMPLYTPRQARRHEVKPGITGWAQINGRNAITWEEKFELDVWYVENQSFCLDLKILCLTLVKVLDPRGISEDGCATVQDFTGSRNHQEMM
ncbi:sugar transferase [Brevibacillus massiliensis]|uniref:sugar transferase n=1 Tax=Brevibacillus massiliensis TaxID=1118054 RepID=UPI000300F0F5|nr:sugar transferase [Brevibacillus massiliensis]